MFNVEPLPDDWLRAGDPATFDEDGPMLTDHFGRNHGHDEALPERGEETLEVADAPPPDHTADYPRRVGALPSERTHGQLVLEVCRLRRLLEAGAAAARHARQLIRDGCHATASAVLEVYAAGIDSVLRE